MQPYDMIMLVILAATTIFGAIKGFAWQVASLASIVASYVVAQMFRNDVARMINAQPPWNVFLAMLLLYFGSSLVIWMLFRLVSTSIDKIRLKEFDRHLGAGFGLLKGVLICMLITMFAMTLLGKSQQQRIANSSSGRYISRILASADGILPAEVKQVIGPYIDNVEQQLEQNRITNGQPVGPEDGFLDGLGKIVEDRVKQLGTDAINPQGQGGPFGNGGFFGGQGQGGQGQGNTQPLGLPTGIQNPFPSNIFPSTQPQQPSGWPNIPQQPINTQPQQPAWPAPLPNNGWPANVPNNNQQFFPN